ncbi:MAG: hypothetical protein BroJett013_14610 [Alphaproteobacteria bacterium]|nr:MAG: hypothetical protein BroJett013_14610 [Alphaproteobacteria bacterium]
MRQIFSLYMLRELTQVTADQHLAARSIATAVAADPRALVLVVGLLLSLTVLILEPGAAWLRVT